MKSKAETSPCQLQYHRGVGNSFAETALFLPVTGQSRFCGRGGVDTATIKLQTSWSERE